MRMRAEGDRVHLVVALAGDPGLDDVPAEEEVPQGPAALSRPTDGRPAMAARYRIGARDLQHARLRHEPHGLATFYGSSPKPQSGSLLSPAGWASSLSPLT